MIQVVLAVCGALKQYKEFMNGVKLLLYTIIDVRRVDYEINDIEKMRFYSITIMEINILLF